MAQTIVTNIVISTDGIDTRVAIDFNGKLLAGIGRDTAAALRGLAAQIEKHYEESRKESGRTF